jgi:hypothetical protein
MPTLEGTVSGIDVIATPGKPVRFFAFVKPNVGEEIQVTAELHQLQTALELASSKQVEVEVTFEKSGPENKLNRVRLMDR